MIPYHHDFYLIELREKPLLGDSIELHRQIRYCIENDDSTLLSVLGKVHIHDHLMEYLYSSFYWVPLDYRDENDVDQFGMKKGISYSGCEVFSATACQALNSLVSGWISIFSVAPKKIRLMSTYGRKESDHLLDKTEVIGMLKQLLSFVDRLEVGDPIYLVYSGL